MSFTEGIRFQAGETLTLDKISKLAANSQFLFENRTVAQYQAYDLTRTQGVKIAAGVVYVPPAPNSPLVQPQIYFGNFFTTGCNPVVTASFTSGDASRSYISLRGLAGGHSPPNHNGFRAIVRRPTDADRVTGPLNIHWIAVGY